MNSTLAAETQSLAGGVGDLLWMIVMYLEFATPAFQLRDWRCHVRQQGYTAFTKEENSEDLAQAVAVWRTQSLFTMC